MFGFSGSSSQGNLCGLLGRGGEIWTGGARVFDELVGAKHREQSPGEWGRSLAILTRRVYNAYDANWTEKLGSKPRSAITLLYKASTHTRLFLNYFKMRGMDQMLWFCQ